MIIHILHHGRALCLFTDCVPGDWPDGHKWVGKDEATDATCIGCIAVNDGKMAAPEIPTKIFTVAHLPQHLVQAWLQHLRDFDVKYPRCHFEVGIDGPDESIAHMLDRIRVEPGLTFTKIFERTKWEAP